ncbi:MAG: type I restriction-modification enzyme R subunit C-terminal domain-containing protein [Pseudonocardiaceae bacterium]
MTESLPAPSLPTINDVDQRWFLDRIASAVASRLYVTEDTLDDIPFTENGGVGRSVAAFGDDRAAELLDELNRELPE